MDFSFFKEPTFFWFSTALILGMLEMLSGDFILFSIAFGALGGGIFAWFDLSVYLQFIAFIIFALVFYFAIRPMWKKYLDKSIPNVKMNMDSLVGKTITISELNENSSKEGWTKVYGDVWRVEHLKGNSVEKNRDYIVMEIKSNRLIIKEKES